MGHFLQTARSKPVVGVIPALLHRVPLSPLPGHEPLLAGGRVPSHGSFPPREAPCYKVCSKAGGFQVIWEDVAPGRGNRGVPSWLRRGAPWLPGAQPRHAGHGDALRQKASLPGTPHFEAQTPLLSRTGARSCTVPRYSRA